MRITNAILDRAVTDLNRLLGQNPEPYTETAEGFVPNVGTMTLYIDAGTVALNKMEAGGAQRRIFTADSKAEMFAQVEAAIWGIANAPK